MSWAYMDDVGYKVLKAMQEVNPKCIMLYIGEWEGGCTANDDFFSSIQEIEDKEFDEAVKHFKQWRGIHDYPQLVR